MNQRRSRLSNTLRFGEPTLRCESEYAAQMLFQSASRKLSLSCDDPV
jgi:hypothetical protein